MKVLNPEAPYPEVEKLCSNCGVRHMAPAHIPTREPAHRNLCQECFYEVVTWIFLWAGLTR